MSIIDDTSSLRDDVPCVKALAITDRTNKDCDPFILLTADQIVLFGTEIREKPTSEAQAIEFLSSYSNRDVSTISAVVATHFPTGRLKHHDPRFAKHMLHL